MKKIGIVGCGAVTQISYSKVLRLFPDVEVVAVCDTNLDNATKVANIFNASIQLYEDLLELVDIVIIATPPSSHFALVSAALKKNLTVICEKPFVGTEKEANGLIELALKYDNSRLYVAHFRRNYPSAELAKEIVTSGILGKIKKITAFEGGRFSWKTQSGYVFNDPFGGVLFDTGSHTIDMALYAANLDSLDLKVELINFNKDKEEPAHEIDANLVLKVITENAIDFHVKLSRRIVLANKIKIIGENGFVEFPTDLSNVVRLGTEAHSTIVYASHKYDTLMDCFAVQFKYMFSDKLDEKFTANKFINLTKIMEGISNAK